MSGPVPKRSSQRRRRNKDENNPLRVVEIEGGPVAAPPADDEWHPLARDWYVSLRDSGQTVFFEPSDWAQARITAELLSRELMRDRAGANMVAEVFSSMGELLTSEGARRRVRVELNRSAGPAVSDATASIMDAYRARLG